MVGAVADGHIDIMPEVLVTGGAGGALDGLAATVMNLFRPNGQDHAQAVDAISMDVDGEEADQEEEDLKVVAG